MCVGARVRECVCICVCMCEREREIERESGGGGVITDVNVPMSNIGKEFIIQSRERKSSGVLVEW